MKLEKALEQRQAAPRGGLHSKIVMMESLALVLFCYLFLCYTCYMFGTGKLNGQPEMFDFLEGGKMRDASIRIMAEAEEAAVALIDKAKKCRGWGCRRG